MINNQINQDANILSPISHLDEICKQINSFLDPKDLFQVMLTCNQYHKWVIESNLKPHVKFGIRKCLENKTLYTKSLKFLMETFVLTIDQLVTFKLTKDDLLSIVNMCVIDPHRVNDQVKEQVVDESELDELMYHVIGLIPDIDFKAILDIPFKNQEKFEIFFRHPKLFERLDEFHNDYLSHFDINNRNLSVIEYFFNSSVFQLERSLNWLETHTVFLPKLLELHEKIQHFPKLREIVISNFPSIYKLSPQKWNKIVRRLSIEERRQCQINEQIVEFQLSESENTKICRYFGSKIISLAKSSKHSYALSWIAITLHYNPKLLKNFDLKTYGCELIAKQEYSIISLVLSDLKLKFIEEFVPSPISFLILLLRHTKPTMNHIEFPEDDFISLIETIFKVFPDLKINRKVKREVYNYSIKIKQVIMKCESDESDDSEDEESIRTTLEIIATFKVRRNSMIELLEQRNLNTNSIQQFIFSPTINRK